MDPSTILEAIRDGIVVTDGTGAITYANSTAGTLLGMSAKGLAGCVFAKVCGERLRGGVALLGSVVPGGSAIRTSVTDASGRETALEIACEQASDGTDAGRVFTMRDVQARVELEGRVAVREALAAMADAFVQMAARPDLPSVARVVVETLVNRLGGAAARMWLRPEHGSGALELQSWAGLPPEIDGASLVAGSGTLTYGLGLDDAVRAGQVAIGPNGTSAPPAWFDTQAMAAYVLQPLAVGDVVVGVLGYFARDALTPELMQVITAFARHCAVAVHDMSEQAAAREQIEALAREAHARTGEFEAIVSNMPDAVIVARGGAITFVNDTTARMLGVNSADELLLPIEQFAQIASLRQGDGNPTALETLTFTRVLSGEVITGREGRMTNARTGREVWVQVSGAPLRDPSGVVQGAVVVATEITRLKELEHSKDEWLAIAAHELRTPLTPITVHLQMAQRRLHMGRALDPDVFDKALDQVKRLARLVNGLLDVTRLQAGQLDLIVEDVELRELAESIVERVRHSAPHHTLVLDSDERAVWVRGDRARLDEVLAALVDNAIKYSPGGGEVWVTVRRTPKGEASVSVRDAGIGIAEEERGQIFERYFRAGSVPHTQYGGLGLGLWIAGKVVQKHGGRIELESRLGRGSTFDVVLPLAGAAVPEASGETFGTERRTRVLVVDDDVPVLEAVQDLLQDDGYDVHVARSGLEALAEAREWVPDVMLLDLRMPGMDGWEVRRRFAADPALAHIPIVLVSADRDARMRAAGMDVQGFVSKPFDLDEIERVLSRLTSDTGASPTP